MTQGFADLLSLWSHALAALLFAALGLWAWRARRRRTLAAALGLTALWALAVAGVGGADGVTRLFEALRNLGWLAFVWRLHSGSIDRPVQRAALIPHVTLAAVMTVGGLLGFAGAVIRETELAAGLADAALMLRLLAAVASLVLVQNAYARTTNSALRAIALGVAAIWLVDVNLLTLAWATGEWPAAMLAVRGAVMVAVAGVLAANLDRNADRPVQLSRAVTVQSLSLLAMLSYLAIFAGLTEGLAALGGRQARVLQTAFVFGSTAAALAILSTPTLRAWLRVKVAKHLFRHRYDYRAEWMRFTAMLGRADAGQPLGERIARAIAELLDSPAALLLGQEGDTLTTIGGWHWDETTLPHDISDARLTRHLASTGRVIELDAVRNGAASEDRAVVPQSLIDLVEAWAIVPLPHQGGLAGAVVLARPIIARALDWEDFDLLKVAGPQAAMALAEYQAQARLADAERFDEFNRRFAFILHDIKNLVSQLSLVARNAERHADNPAFRADMVTTLNESATRMADLVARLSQSRAQAPAPPRATALHAIADALAAERRLIHPVVVTGDCAALALADPAGVEQVLRHLIQNAIEASPPGEPVCVAISRNADRAVVEVIDRGCGMSAAFVRERLFRPFASTKPSGFGIGAYEARSVTLAMGGTLDVVSRENEGTRFTLSLPAAESAQLEVAA